MIFNYVLKFHQPKGNVFLPEFLELFSYKKVFDFVARKISGSCWVALIIELMKLEVLVSFSGIFLQQINFALSYT